MRALFILSIFSTLALADEAKETVTVDVPTTQCEVRPSFSHITFGGNCFSGEVMTGIYNSDPLQIRCAELRATCTVELPKAEEKK